MPSVSICPYTIGTTKCTDTTSLASALGSAWNSGIYCLSSGDLQDHFKKTNKQIAQLCASVERKLKARPQEQDILFLEWICRLPGSKSLYWKGHCFGGLKQMVTTLPSCTNTPYERLIFLMLREKLLSVYLENEGKSSSVVARVKYLENCFNKKGCLFNKRNSTIILYHILLETNTFSLAGETLFTIQDLAQVLQRSAEISKAALERKIEPLFQSETNFQPLFEAWLINLDKGAELSSWREKFQIGAINTADSIDYGIGVSAPADSRVIQQGPISNSFSNDAAVFVPEFEKVLLQYQDSLSDPQRFTGIIHDLFPQNRLQTDLLLNAYKMDIIRSMSEASTLSNQMALRFVRRLTIDFAVQEEYAKWAVTVWFSVYGERILNKPHTYTPDFA